MGRRKPRPPIARLWPRHGGEGIAVPKLAGGAVLGRADQEPGYDTRRHLPGGESPRAAFDDAHLQLAAAIGGILGAPFENARRLEWLESENRRLQEAVDIEHDMVGGGPRMREIFQFIGKVAPTDSTVLIRGESGTGKELVARAIHRNSPRAGQRFLAINCAALTETLLESELFGHEKGAFTGAIVRKQGKLEMADRGTLFLDEVGELPLAFQSKLLRVLQEREFERVGGTQPIRVDVRILARDQPRPGKRHRQRRLPQRPLLQAECRVSGNAAFARSPRRHSDAGPILRRQTRQAGHAQDWLGSLRKRWPVWRLMTGRATCGNSRMPSNAPSCWARPT